MGYVSIVKYRQMKENRAANAYTSREKPRRIESQPLHANQKSVICARTRPSLRQSYSTSGPWSPLHCRPVSLLAALRACMRSRAHWSISPACPHGCASDAAGNGPPGRTFSRCCTRQTYARWSHVHAGAASPAVGNWGTPRRSTHIHRTMASHPAPQTTWMDGTPPRSYRAPRRTMSDAANEENSGDVLLHSCF